MTTLCEDHNHNLKKPVFLMTKLFFYIQPQLLKTATTTQKETKIK
jgi:hypothetical protein